MLSRCGPLASTSRNPVAISGYEPLRSDIYLHYIVDASAVQLGRGIIGHALENSIENAHTYLDPVVSHLASTAHNLYPAQAQGVSDHNIVREYV